MSTFLAVAAWLEHYSILGMLAVFLLIFATTYWPGRKADIERHGHIPLDDDQAEPQS